MSLALEHEHLFTVSEFGEMIRKHKSRVYWLIRTGQLGGIRSAVGHEFLRVQQRRTWMHVLLLGLIRVMPNDALDIR
jgi:hypothetical protein